MSLQSKNQTPQLSSQEKEKLTLDGKEAIVQSRNPKFSGGFKTIIKDQGGHLVHELIQNAQDTGATEIKVELHTDKLEFWHNGNSFSYTNIESLTSLGGSDKSENKSTIGKFGFGFKSVFSITNKPIIKCDTCCFEIIDIFCPVFLPNEDTNGWTKFIFEFIDGQESKIHQNLKEKLQNDITERSILFLSNIQKLSISILQDESNIVISKKIMNRKQFEEMEISFIKNSLNEVKNYLYFKKQLEYKDKKIDYGVCYQYQMIGKSYEFIKIKNTNNLSVYFPTKDNFTLKFFVNGGFVTGSSRENCELRDEFNSKLFNSTKQLVISSALILRDLDILNLSFLDLFSNLETQSCIYDFNNQLHQSIQNILKKENIIPVENDSKYDTLPNCARLSDDILKFFDVDEMIALNFDKSLVKTDINNKLELKRFFEIEGLIKINLYFLINQVKSKLYKDKDDNWFIRFYDFIAKENNSKWLELDILKLNTGSFCSNKSKLYLGQNEYGFRSLEIEYRGFKIINNLIFNTENSNFLKFLRTNSKIYTCFEILTSNPELTYGFDDNKLIELYQKLITKKVNWSEIKIIKTNKNTFVAGNSGIFNPFKFKSATHLKLENTKINQLNKFFETESEITQYFEEERGFAISNISDILLSYPNLVCNFEDGQLANLYRYLFGINDRFGKNLKIVKLDDNSFISGDEVDEIYAPSSSISSNSKFSNGIKVLNKLFFEEQNKDILQNLRSFFEIKEFNELDNILKIVIPEIENNINFVENITIVEKALQSDNFRKGDKVEIRDKLKEIDFVPLKEIDDSDDEETIFNPFDVEFYGNFDRDKYSHLANSFRVYKLDTNLIDSSSIIIKECCNHYYSDFSLFQTNQHICEILKSYLETNTCERQTSQSILDHLADYVEQNPNKLDKYREILNNHSWLMDKNSNLVTPSDIKIEECILEIQEIVAKSGILNFKVEKEYSKQTKSEVGEDNMELLNHMEKEGVAPDYVKQLIEDDKRKKEEEKQAKKDEEERVKQAMEKDEESQENIPNSQNNNSPYDVRDTSNPIKNPEFNNNIVQKTNSQNRSEKIRSEVEQICDNAPDEIIQVTHHTRSKPDRRNEGKARDKYYQNKNDAENNMTDQELYQKFEESQDQKAQNKIVGFKAEERAYVYLCNKYGSKNVTWNNQNGESGTSWDMEVEDGEDTIFYEIKGKINTEPRKCYITSGEWHKAKIELDNFVMLIIVLEKSIFTEIKNPYQEWLDGKIEINPLVLGY